MQIQRHRGGIMELATTTIEWTTTHNKRVRGYEWEKKEIRNSFTGLMVWESPGTVYEIKILMALGQPAGKTGLGNPTYIQWDCTFHSFIRMTDKDQWQPLAGKTTLAAALSSCQKWLEKKGIVFED